MMFFQSQINYRKRQGGKGESDAKRELRSIRDKLRHINSKSIPKFKSDIEKLQSEPNVTKENEAKFLKLSKKL